MKMNLKKSLTFTLILLLTSQVYSNESGQATTDANAAPDQAGADKKPADAGQKCNMKMLKDFGFKGQETATEMELSMCPTVKQSCCAKEDQLMMYDLWVTGKSQENLESKFRTQSEVSIYISTSELK
jgi:hypothetical protein